MYLEDFQNTHTYMYIYIRIYIYMKENKCVLYLLVIQSVSANKTANLSLG